MLVYDSNLMGRRDREIERLFDIAVDLSLEAQAEFLDKECGHDVDLKHELMTLLANDNRATHSQLKKLERVVALNVSPMELEPGVPSWVNPGASINQYVLVRKLGSGGMGTVFLAQDTKLDRKVAIKLVRGTASSTANADGQLLQEAKTMAQLSHPNVVQVYEVGACQGHDYVAMEYVRGTTLRGWLDSIANLGRRARQRQVLRQFLGAGRGLEAAHKAGLVHCDFKPDNVMVGDDGRPRVGDFGLARLVASRVWVPSSLPIGDGPPGTHDEAEISPIAETIPVLESETDASRAKASRVLTAGGMIVGTPQYMSPEQWRGHLADSRSDQFGFCVALYEALYGKPPYPGDSCSELMDSVTNGKLEPPPRHADVPAPVRKALLQGLMLEPADRFPDMSALLHALEEWPRRRRRRLLLGIAAVGVASIGVLFYVTPRGHEPCAEAGTAIDAVWNTERRATIGRAFAQTVPLDSSKVWQVVEQQLDEYARSWKRDSFASCQATYLRDEQSPELFDRRQICLDHGLRRLEALLDGLALVDSETVEGVLTAAADLPDLAACRNAEGLRYGVEPPPAAEARSVAAVRDRLAEARTLQLLGRRDEALRLARGHLDAARELSYPPVRGEALYQLGRILIYRGERTDIEHGEELLHKAVYLATGERHDELAVEALSFLVLSALRNHDNTQRGHELSDRLFAMVRRSGDRPRDLAEALRYRALLLVEDGQLSEAEENQRRGLEVLASDEDAPWLFRAEALRSLAATARDRRKYEEASVFYEEAHALYARLGDNHPTVATIRFGQGVLELRRGNRARARNFFQSALSVRLDSLGESHPLVGAVYLALANIDQQAGRLDSAEALAVAGQRIYEQVYEPSDARVVDTYQLIGAIRYRREDYGGARVAYEKALTGLIARVGPEDVRVAYAHANLAEAALALGHHEQALTSIDLAESVFAARRVGRERSEPALDGFMAGVRGQALLGNGQVVEAVKALGKAVEHFSELTEGGVPLERAAVHWALARAFATLDSGKSARARSQGRLALSLFEQGGAAGRKGVVEVQRWLGQDTSP